MTNYYPLFFYAIMGAFILAIFTLGAQGLRHPGQKV